jgi:preprotein translocase subunit YajC
MNDILAYFPLLQEGGGQLLTMILPFGLIILVFYFLIIRPQSKKQKETQKMLSALKKNDRVVTVGGIRGTITSVKEDTVIIKVDDNVKMEFSKSAVSNVVSSRETPSDSKDPSSKGEQGKDSKEDKAEPEE